MSADLKAAGNFFELTPLPIVTANVWTIAMWVKLTSATPPGMHPFQIKEVLDSTNFISPRIAQAGAPYRVRIRGQGAGGGATNYVNQSTNGFNGDITNWHLVVYGYQFSVPDAYAVMDADWANRGQFNQSRDNTGCDFITIGDGSPYAELDGLIAEMCAWDVLLTQSEVEALRTGVSTGPAPNTIRAADVAGYWPMTTLTTNEDQEASADLTEIGAVTYDADHPIITGTGGGASPILVVTNFGDF